MDSLRCFFAYPVYSAVSKLAATAIEFFNGPHTINGVGTFEFLEKHLNWPKP